MTPLEQRYRRTLRLLPAGYRQIWEDDMVDAYMERASHDGGDARSGRSRAEHLSVLGLAVRLRLSGAHLSPRGLAWRGAAHGFVLIALLYLAVNGILTVTSLVERSLSDTGFAPATTQDAVLYWADALPALLWVAAFVAVVGGRAAATRVLVTLAFIAWVTLTIVNVQRTATTLGVTTPELGDWVLGKVIGSAVLSAIVFAIVTIAALIVPDGGVSRTSRARSFWLGGATLLALVLIPVATMADTLPARVTAYVSLAGALHLGLLIAMVTALAVRRQPRALLALAFFAVLFAGRGLLDYVQYILDGRAVGQVYFSPLSYMQRFDVGLIVLAVICAIVGLIGLRRLPPAQPAAAQA